MAAETEVRISNNYDIRTTARAGVVVVVAVDEDGKPVPGVRIRFTPTVGMVGAPPQDTVEEVTNDGIAKVPWWGVPGRTPDTVEISTDSPKVARLYGVPISMGWA